MDYKLFVQKYPQEGDLQHSYSPLKNKIKEDNSIDDFNTTELSIDLNNPLNIECQPSYDGTVNLIINDDKNPPRIINSRFTKIEDNRFRVINRNQTEQTNLYREGEIDLQTRLFRNINKMPRFNFIEMNYFGQLKGGNYTFYMKYADSDYNKTDVACESSQISVFKGNLLDINSISGTLQDERTDKAIKLQITNIDETFTKFYLYYTREYSDVNGFRLTETIAIKEPYEIKGSTQEVIINGFEETEEISTEELNIQYNYVTNVKTQAQVQNMLFFGNIENVNVDIKNLQNISYFFEVSFEQKENTIGWIDPATYQPKEVGKLEYYDPKNIYYNLGYWPEEIYRLGVVYIMKDDSLSPVFNLRGCEFKWNDGELTSNVSESKIPYKTLDPSTGKLIINYLERDTFLTSEKNLSNTFGVFKNPEETDSMQLQYGDETKPFYYKINIPVLDLEDGTKCDLIEELRKYGVKGFFFVRQKRIPTTLCQGVSVGIDSASSVPMLYDPNKKNYFSESFLDQNNGKLSYLFENRKVTSNNRNGSALLSVDVNLSPILRTSFDGSSFLLQKVRDNGTFVQNGRKFTLNPGNRTNLYRSAKCSFMDEDVPYRYIDGFGFSTRAGDASATKSFSFFESDENSQKEKADNYKLIRGIYAPFVAVCSNLDNNAIYNIKVQNYSHQYIKDYFGIRRDDNSPFYAISDRFDLLNENRTQNVYRGDCFTNTVSLRLNRNFIDPDVPVNDTIVDENTWISHYNGYFNTTIEDDDKEKNKNDGPDGNWLSINRADLNTVPMGMWITYKCRSNYNLGLRAEDRSYPSEEALMGNPRSFYPLSDASTKSANKIAESFILNDGYSATVGRKTNIEAPNVPYIKDFFDSRIMFSNIQVDGDFRNSYRVFQGLSFEDIDRQYGAIVKLIPWGVNLFCVFEHGLGIVPINEKALIQTTTDQSVHMYGAGVLQKQITLISADFGSIWPESIVRTPIGIYGVDTYAKKIWRFSQENGLETISDMKIQRFLNDNITLKEKDKYPIIGLKNVKTHFNNYKGDVMFTFYNFVEGKEWNLCYNERMGKWITRYSWTPLYSENINNIFYSMDKKRSEILGHIYDNQNSNLGIRTSNNQWELEDGDLTQYFDSNISLVGIDFATGFDLKVESIKTSYIIDGEEKFIEIPLDCISIEDTEDPLIKHLSWTKFSMENGIDLPEEVGHSVPLYYKINVVIRPEINGATAINEMYRTIGVVVDYKYNQEKYDELLVNGFYVHGRAGIFNEIDYNDEKTHNQILPTKWYNKQEPFEFEFVVNNEVGLHKVFENLVIISNRVQPKSFEFEITGDVYSLFKQEVQEGFLNHEQRGEFSKERKQQFESEFMNVHLEKDPILNQHHLVISQDCKDVERFGRRLGNIHYKEDSWYVTIDPIKFKSGLRARQSTRIRDKYLKVRVKYSGEDLVIITALKTLMSITHN